MEDAYLQKHVYTGWGYTEVYTLDPLVALILYISLLFSLLVVTVADAASHTLASAVPSPGVPFTSHCLGKVSFTSSSKPNVSL